MQAATIRTDYRDGELVKLCRELMADTDKRLAKVVSVPSDQADFERVALAFENTIADFSDRATKLTFMKYVSTDPRVNEQGAQCDELLDEYGVNISTRKDLYDAIRAVKPRSPAEVKLHQEMLREFEMNGLKLPDEKRQQVRELMTQLSGLESKFSTHLNQDQTTVEFTETELDGLPEAFMKRLKKTDGGKYIVTTKSTDYVQVMENAKNRETRKGMLRAYQQRAADTNVPLLEEAIVLRQKIAALMGYATWADYRMTDRMAKDSKNVLQFLNGLRSKLAKRNREDLNRLRKFQRKLDPSAKELEIWDVTYVANQLKKQDFQLDNEKIREYFPADTVVKGMFEVYSTLFGVSYSEVKNAKVWADGVKLYEVKDAQSNETIAYFYTDFYPRALKYGHAAAFTLISGRGTPVGYNVPLSAIVANFTPPSDGKPSLLTHDEVETVFHEFGHIMHQTLTRAPFASLSGSRTQRDFVEAPSQMLEEWVWSPEILDRLSGHYQDSSKKLPVELRKQLIAARYFNQGLFYTRQLFLALLDMEYHTRKGKVDTTALHHKLYREISGLEPLPEGRFQAGWGHLMGGYDAGYYGYLWSEVYAADMFSRFEKEGLLSHDLGMRYRRAVLEKGRMTEGLEMLREFLEREPNQKAFFKRLGVGG